MPLYSVLPVDVGGWFTRVANSSCIYSADTGFEVGAAFFNHSDPSFELGPTKSGFQRDMNEIWSVPTMKIKAYALITLFMTSSVAEAQVPAKWEWTA